MIAIRRSRSQAEGGRDEAQRWLGFQAEGKVHAPQEDAEAALRIVLRELRLLRAEASRTLCEWDGTPPAQLGTPGQMERRVSVFARQTGLVRALTRCEG